MSSDMTKGFSCPNPLCDSDDLFPDYDAVCAHLNIPLTHCSKWAMDFIDRMTQNIDDQYEDDGRQSLSSISSHL